MPITALHKCKSCGGNLSRVHRTFKEKFGYSSVYRCAACGERQASGTWLNIDRNHHAICPSCGTGKITRLKKKDPIERLYRSPRSFFARLFGGALYHCRFCRLQFYDLRRSI